MHPLIVYQTDDDPAYTGWYAFFRDSDGYTYDYAGAYDTWEEAARWAAVLELSPQGV